MAMVVSAKELAPVVGVLLALAPSAAAAAGIPRRLQNCPAGHCWVASRQDCYHNTSQECRNQWLLNGDDLSQWNVLGGNNNNPNNNPNGDADGDGIPNWNDANPNGGWDANGNWNGNNGHWYPDRTEGGYWDSNGNWVAAGAGVHGSGAGTDWYNNGNDSTTTANDNGQLGNGGAGYDEHGNWIVGTNNNNWNNNNWNDGYWDANGNWIPAGAAPAGTVVNNCVLNGNGDGCCQAAQCWVAALGGCFHITSLECRNPPPTPRPTPRPIRRPTPNPTFGMITTVHPVQVVLAGLGNGAGMAPEVRAYIIRWAKEVLEAELHPDLELVNVASAGYLNTNENGVVALPLRVAVRGRADVHEYALTYILDALRDRLSDLGVELKNLDRAVYKNVNLSTDSYDIDMLTTQTKNPTKRPTPRPTPRPTQRMVTSSHAVQLLLRNLPEDHTLSGNDRDYIVRLIREFLEGNLHPDVALIDVGFAGHLVHDGTHASLPLRITVRHPAGSRGAALSYILDAMRDYLPDLVVDLKSFDWGVFKGVNLDVDTYDFDDLVDHPPTRSPTLRPVLDIVTTFHPLKVMLRNLPAEYRLGYEAREVILDAVRRIIEDNLDNELELIDIVWDGHMVNDRGNKRLSVPLRVTLRGPEDVSEFALDYLLDVVRMHDQDILTKLKALEWSVFKDAILSTDTYDFGTVVDETERPTRKPTPNPTPYPTRDPTSRPTMFPTPFPTRKPSTRPTLGSVTTNHDVRLVFKNVDTSYILSTDDRTSIVGFVEDILRENLDESFQLIDVYAGDSNEGNSLRWLHFSVTVTGPVDSSDMALAYILSALEDDTDDLERMIKSLDWDSFKEVVLIAEPHDPSNVPANPTTEVSVETGSSPSTSGGNGNGEVKFVETEHSVELTFNNVPSGVRLSSEDRASAIRYIKEVLEENLEFPVELIECEYAGGDDRTLFSSRRLANFYLPLRITVKHPTDFSGIALSYVMDALEENMQDIMRKMESLDWDAFGDASMSLGSYDPASPTESQGDMVKTEHPVELILKNVAATYRLSAKDRVSMVHFLKELLDDRLDESLNVVDVVYAGRRRLLSSSLRNVRRLDTLTLPLLITVMGPSDQKDFTLSFIMDVFDEYAKDIENYLKTLDGNAFAGVSVAAESFAFDAAPTDMVETEHAVELILDNVSSRYLSASDRESIVRFVTQLLDDNLDGALSLIDVAYAGRRSLQHARRLDTLSLPLLVTVRGPRDEKDSALAYIMDILQDNDKVLIKYLRSLDRQAFKDVYVVAKSHEDVASMVGSSAGSAGMEDSEHLVRLVINDVPSGFQLTASNRASVVQYVKRLLAEDLDESLELIEVSYAGISRNRQLLAFTRGRSGSISLPLFVTVRGPADETDLAEWHIMQAMRENLQVIELFLKTIDGGAFENAAVFVESSSSPSKATIMNEEEDWWIQPWWVWLLVGLGALFLCCCLCLCCGCMYRQWRKSSEVTEDKPIVVGKPVIVEKPLIVDRPVLYPQIMPPPPNTMVPYQLNQSSMVPYQQIVAENPPLMALPYAPHQGQPQSSRRRVMLPYEQDDVSMASSYETGSTASIVPNRQRLEPPEELRQSQIRAHVIESKKIIMGKAYDADDPPEENALTISDQKEKVLQICADPNRGERLQICADDGSTSSSSSSGSSSSGESYSEYTEEESIHTNPPKRQFAGKGEEGSYGFA